MRHFRSQIAQCGLEGARSRTSLLCVEGAWVKMAAKAVASAKVCALLVPLLRRRRRQSFPFSWLSVYRSFLEK